MNPLALKRAFRNAGYLALFAVWLAVMILPCFAFVLAARGEISWQRGQHTSDRLWLVQERDHQGLGYGAERVISGGGEAGGPVCVRSTVRFLMWEGSAQGENTEYCECYAADGTITDIRCP